MSLLANDLIALLNSPLVQGAANATQLASIGINASTLNNSQLLIEINRLFQFQNSEKLDVQFAILIKSILQNEQIIKNEEIIIALNEQILVELKLINKKE